MTFDNYILSTPLSEGWPLWVMFGLLVCLFITEWQQPGTIRTAFRMTFTRLERTYGDSATSLLGSLFLNIFRIGTLALTINLMTNNGDFPFVRFAIIIGAIVAVMMVKMFFGWLVGYTFELRRVTDLYIPHYDNLWTVLAVLLYPFVLLFIHLNDSIIMPWLILALVGVFAMAVMIKLFMHFYAGAQSVVYIIVYMVTLEILPLAALFYGATILE